MKYSGDFLGHAIDLLKSKKYLLSTLIFMVPTQILFFLAFSRRVGFLYFLSDETKLIEIVVILREWIFSIERMSDKDSVIGFGFAERAGYFFGVRGYSLRFFI